jgi:hypothetical protein
MQGDAARVRRAVARLEAQGLVRTGPEGVEVLDPPGLRRFIGQDDAASGES